MKLLLNFLLMNIWLYLWIWLLFVLIIFKFPVQITFRKMYNVNWYWKIIKMRKSSGWKSFCQLKLLLNTPTLSNSSIFPLLNNVVHTLDMQHHLIKLYIEYTNTLNPQQVTALGCSDQPIYALSKIIENIRKLHFQSILFYLEHFTLRRNYW